MGKTGDVGFQPLHGCSMPFASCTPVLGVRQAQAVATKLVSAGLTLLPLRWPPNGGFHKRCSCALLKPHDRDPCPVSVGIVGAMNLSTGRFELKATSPVFPSAAQPLMPRSHTPTSMPNGALHLLPAGAGVYCHHPVQPLHHGHPVRHIPEIVWVAYVCLGFSGVPVPCMHISTALDTCTSHSGRRHLPEPTTSLQSVPFGSDRILFIFPCLHIFTYHFAMRMPFCERLTVSGSLKHRPC